MLQLFLSVTLNMVKLNRKLCGVGVDGFSTIEHAFNNITKLWLG